MPVSATTPIELVEQVYSRLPARVALGRERLGRPLTLAEKVLINHLRDPHGQELERGRSYADFDPDRVAMQDATAQMALLQFMTAGLPEDFAAALASADASNGEKVALVNGCGGCHSTDPAVTMTGPTWHNLADTATNRVAGESPSLYIHDSIVTPGRAVPRGRR